jgi:mannosyltransferase OCH1-like enzyme
MIPQKIHYFWFGRGEKTELEKKCIERFRAYAPNFEIKEWNEDTFDISLHPYTKAAYAEKKWAFVADYARLKVLYDEGGIYLDTDMYLLKDITPLLEHTAFLGKEDEVHLSAGIIGMEPQNDYIAAVLTAYNSLEKRVPIPRILTDVYDSGTYNIHIYTQNYFYPYTAEEIHRFTGTNAPTESYAVHMWNYSWGNPLIRLAKKARVHRILISITEKFGVKKILKKLLKSE